MQGRTLGRYRIDSLLGEGGMGKVYKAFDDSLGRAAAVKVLPNDVVHDAGRLERFVREARTASSLNHPNVVTIYEVGRDGDGDGTTHFIAMEIVEGDTLRERIMRGRLPIPRAVDLVAQIADGLAAAHAAGVVHRDLKPENVVIAKNGFAKILDFGLAKLREDPALSKDDGATAVKTSPGTLLGSLGYMSPEQARGEDADHRSDIFSLGCILYECVTGTRPFRGDTAVDTLHRILHDDPPPMVTVVPESPAELQRIVRKSLAKEPDQRYQSARDLAIDLHNLKREIESQPGTSAAIAAPAPASRRWWIAAAAIALLLAVAAGAVLLTRRSATTTAVSSAPATPMSLERLTSSGNVTGAVISPDGEYLAYAYSEGGQQSVWVRQIGTGSGLELLPLAPRGIWGIAFSPDSRSIYYATKTSQDTAGTLYQSPILGGTQRRILTGIDSHVSFTADGKRMLFVRSHSPQPGHSAVIVANPDGSDQRTLLSKAPPQSLLLFWGAPAWSPDGKSIAVPLRDGTKAILVRVDLATGKETPMSSDEWITLGDVKWLPDGSGLVLIGATGAERREQMWLLTFDGQRRRITNDLLDYRIISLTDDGKRIVSVAADHSSSIWKASLRDGTQRKISSGKYDGSRGIATATDGTIYFTTIANGRSEMWAMDHAGTRRQITGGEWPSLGVTISPDQRYLVTSMPRENDWVLARLDRDGSGMKVLSRVVGAVRSSPTASFTPDSKFVVFDSSIDGVRAIWKVSIEGGDPVRLFEGDAPAVSPDGSSIAYITPTTIDVATMDGKRTHRFENVSVTSRSVVAWAPDGKAVLHTAAPKDRINIWLQPLDGSPARRVTTFDDEYIHNFARAEGNDLILARGSLSRDAVMISNFR